MSQSPGRKRSLTSCCIPNEEEEKAPYPTLCPDSLNKHAGAAGGETSGQRTETNNAAYFHWPGSTRLIDNAGERASYFRGLQKDLDPLCRRTLPVGQQATSLLDLMIIRAFHSRILRRYSLGTAVGFRMKNGELTDVPAILVFVSRKVHKKWLLECQVLPTFLEGPGGIWCDVDVMEFSYYTSGVLTQREQVYTELVEGLRGSDPHIGPGSQVSSQETYGTLGAIVKSRTGPHQIGFVTNRHVAVDLDYPNQKMFHPLPPNLGPGVYLGAVERATSFITDELWYGIFASKNPETFVRADGAFVPFSDSFDMTKVTTTVKGVGEMGQVMRIDLQASVGSIIGKPVVKVGRSSGLTKGTILAYALEYNDEKGICFFTDFLVVGENQQAFDLEGDSGSLILITPKDGEKPLPVGIIWGGTANRGRLKLKDGSGPESWTSAVDLGRLLDVLQLDLVTSDASLQAVPHYMNANVYHRAEAVISVECFARSTSVATIKDTIPKTNAKVSVGGKSKADGQTIYFEDMSNYRSRMTSQNNNGDTVVLFPQTDFITRLAEPSTSVEHQFMQDFHVSLGTSNQSKNQAPGNLSELRDSDDGFNDDISIGLQLGDNSKRHRAT